MGVFGFAARAARVQAKADALVGGALAMGEARRPLRFCMVATFYPPFHFCGNSVFVERLVKELAGRGHSVDVIHNIDA